MSKKHSKKSRPESVTLSPEEEEVLHSLLEDLSNIGPSALVDRLQNVRLALHFLDTVPPEHPRTLESVLAVESAFPEKGIQKAVRRALFRLKQKGVPIPARGPESTVTEVHMERPPEPSAYLSPPDGTGARAVLIVIPKVPAGVDLGMGIVSDEKGVLEFVYGRYSKKKSREAMDFFFRSVEHLFETSLPHAATVLEAAYQKGQTGSSQAGDYLTLRPWLLENVSLLKASPVHDLIPPEAAFPLITPSQVEKLLGHAWMASWILDPDSVRPLMEEIANAQQSPILISEEQKSGRIQSLKEDFLSRTYTDEKRALTKARLEETAYLLQKAGEGEYARIALSAALSMDEKDSQFRSNVFLRHLLENSLRFYVQVSKGELKERAGQPQEQAPSRLILPK